MELICLFRYWGIKLTYLISKKYFPISKWKKLILINDIEFKYNFYNLKFNRVWFDFWWYLCYRKPWNANFWSSTFILRRKWRTSGGNLQWCFQWWTNEFCCRYVVVLYKTKARYLLNWLSNRFINICIYWHIFQQYMLHGRFFLICLFLKGKVKDFGLVQLTLTAIVNSNGWTVVAIWMMWMDFKAGALANQVTLRMNTVSFLKQRRLDKRPGMIQHVTGRCSHSVPMPFEKFILYLYVNEGDWILWKDLMYSMMKS